MSLTHGAPFKADVFVIDAEGGPMVVKDFAPRAWWRRLIGWLEVSRECRAYSYLGPLPFLPEFYGCVDRNALAVEKIEGIALAHAPDREAHRENYLTQIRTALNRLAELGFLHLDARNNKNLLLSLDGRVIFIDLAGSFWIPPGKIGHGLLRRISTLYYEANVIKWETVLHPGGDPRKGMKKPPRYLNGLYDLRAARKRLREREKSSV
ncbi:MAG: hypothetical protein QNL88_07470 [Acidobacteriota bacterium]|nr:hypothetical protein [Acidobacteriota bacterium]